MANPKSEGGNNNLVWYNIQMDDMSAPVRKAYNAYITAQQAFEAEVVKGLKKGGNMEEGQGAKFSYKFGGIGVGVGDTAPKRNTIKV